MIQMYDTTLRDGTQRKNISLSCNDKISIAKRLDDLGVAYIEGGWPGSNPKDAEFFEKAKEITWKNARIAAFGSTCQANKQPADDANIQALLAAQTPTCTIFGKTSVLHVEEVLRTTLENNLRIIEKECSLPGKPRPRSHLRCRTLLRWLSRESRICDPNSASSYPWWSQHGCDV